MAARIGASGRAAAGTARGDVVLRAAGLTKRYRRVVALDGLDLEMGAGEVHAFLGPNGAGKTTTIRILLGLLKADAGDVVLLGGDPWRDAVELHRRLAFAGVAAVGAQLAVTARGARGITIAVLGAAFVLRAVGDTGPAGLSWLS